MVDLSLAQFGQVGIGNSGEIAYIVEVQFALGDDVQKCVGKSAHGIKG
jgi:hypothetical protein